MKVDFYSLAKMDASADLNLNTNSRSIENGVWRQIYCLFTFLLLSKQLSIFLFCYFFVFLSDLPSIVLFDLPLY